MASRHVPESLKRKLLQEAGYRCGVPTCNETTALQFEHIEDWAKLDIKEHDFANMIVLCANCHHRVTHTKDIPKSSILKYKKNLMVVSGRYSIFEIRFLEYLKSMEPWDAEDIAGNEKLVGKIVLSVTTTDQIHLGGFIADGFVILRDAPLLIEQLRKHLVGETILDKPLREHMAMVMNFPTKVVIPTIDGITFMRKFYAGESV